MNRKFIVDEKTLRALGLLSFSDGCPGIQKGYDWYPINELKEKVIDKDETIRT